MFTTEEVATLFGISPKVLKGWVRAGIVKCTAEKVRGPSYRNLFDEDAIWQLLPERLRRQPLTLLSLRPAADILGVDAQTLLNWSEAGLELPINLPSLSSKACRRFALHELELIKDLPRWKGAVRLDVAAHRCGLTRETLLEWAAAGLLPTQPSQTHPHVLLVTGVSLRNCVVRLHYQLPRAGPAAAPMSGATLTLDEVRGMFEVSAERVNDWVQVGLIQTVPDNRNLVYRAAVWQLLPERLRVPGLQLMVPWSAAGLLDVNTSTLLSWDRQGLGLAVRLPQLPWLSHGDRRYARHELEVIRPVPLRRRPLHVGRMAEESGIPESDLRAWIQAGLLTVAENGPAGPLIKPHALRLCLLHLHNHPLQVA